MAKKPPVHVVARKDGWAVVREGNDRATSVRQTQAEAAREGRDIARRHETGFLLHGKDGRVREHSDYGSGHRPQEGMPPGRAMEGFAPGTQALGEPATNEEGQTVQRTTDEHGSIVETAFDEEGDVVEENLVGSVADLPGAEGYEETTEEEGITKRIVKDESGTLIEVQVGPDGSVLDLQIPPRTEKVEENTRQVGQAAQGGQATDGQTADQAQDATGQAAGQSKDDSAGGATEQAQNATGRGTGQDQSPEGQAAEGASPRGQDTGGQTDRRGDGGQRRDEEQTEGQEPNATPAAKRKAEEMGVDLSRTEGTGSDGRITVKDVTSMAGGGQEERVAGGAPQQDEERRAEDQDREAEGGAQDVVGRATGQAVQEVQDTTKQVTRRAQGLVGDLVSRGQQDEEEGRGRSQDTAGQAADQARDAAGGATGGAAQQTRDTAEQAARRDDQEARQGGGQQQGGGGQEPDATDAARRKAQEVGVDLSQVEGSGARGRITVNDVKSPSGPAKGETAGEQRAAGRAEQATQGARGTARQTAEETGEAIRAADAVSGPASGGTDRAAGRSRKVATDGARGGGTLEGRTDDAEEVLGVTDEGRDDDRFEMVREGHANYEVYDQDGERIGRVGHLFLNEDDRPEYLGVEIGLPDGRAVLVPVEVIPTENERRMVVSRPKSVVERGPTFGDGEEVTPELEERVSRHYGLPRSPSIEDRSGHDALLAEGQTEREREGSGAAGSGIRVGDTESGEFREHDRNVEGVSQPGSDLEDEDELRVRRSEEELRVGTREREAGSVNVRKSVRTDRERIEVPTRREEVTVERLLVEGETTETRIGEDEVSVPVVEEEAVVEKRPVVKEEIRIRKDVVEETETVEEDIRREEIEVDDQTERRTR